MKQLVGEREIGSQAEMVRLLHEVGIEGTQASVSRDVRELGLVRVQGRYVFSDEVGLADAIGSSGFESELVISAEPVGAYLIVVKTPPGAASAVAYELDGMALDDIAGTVAGDDTIFVAVRSRSAQGHVLVLLRNGSRMIRRPKGGPGPRQSGPSGNGGAR